MSTIYNTVRLQTLNQKWVQKKESGQALTKKERNERENWTSEDWLLHDFKEQMASNKEASKKTELDNKIISGGVLTPEEEKYLEQNDPEKLKKYRQMRAEKKAYEEKLRKCKTKDEVQRLKTQTLGGYMSALKKIENNPNIPLSEKLAQAQQYLAKTRNIQDAEAKFMATAEYGELPTEAEEAKERAEESSREMDKELEAIMDVAGQNDVEKAEHPDNEQSVGETAVDEENPVQTDQDSDLDEEISDKPKHRVVQPAATDVLADILTIIQRISTKAGAGNGSRVDCSL